MPSKAEAVLAALLAALSSAAPAGATVERNRTKPARVAAAGDIILRDGDLGEPEIELSPVTYLWEHAAEIEIMARGPDGGAREPLFDALRSAVGQAITADRTLGGLCDWVEILSPGEPLDIDEEGGDPIKAASLRVVLYYSTTDPLT